MSEQHKIPFLSLFSAWTPEGELRHALEGLLVRSAEIRRGERAVWAEVEGPLCPEEPLRLQA